MQKTALIVCLIFVGVITANLSPAEARPVSYPGGWTSILENNGDRFAGLLHYSPTATYSLGYRFEYWRDDQYVLQAAQINALLHRINGANSQANLYWKSGVGAAYSDAGAFEDKWAPAAFTGLAVDWEDRRFFVSYENRYTAVGAIADFFMQTARVGIAPYLGSYGDFHTWLMLEVDHKPEDKDPLAFTPMVRVFKGVHLLEFGISDQKDILFNWIVRY